MAFDLNSLTLTTAKRALAEKKLSATELTQACLKRIKLLDKKINAFITITEEKALVDAKRADDLLAREDNSPLLGIPFTLKDVFSTKNIKTSAGSKVLESYTPPFNASVYQFIEDAGGVLLGKTNCDAFGHGSSTENSDFGLTKNPWDIERVAGGSSGGSAAALSYGGGLFSIAEDTGGSIRQPAAFCNVVGLKPTWGLISRYGCIAYASSLDTVGPMARTVEDIECVMNIIEKRDPLDASQNGKPKLRFRKNQKVTIGVVKDFSGRNNDPEINLAIERGIQFLREQGHTIKEVTLPKVAYAIECYYLIATSEASSNLARYDGVRFGNSREIFNEENKRRIILGTFALSSGYHDKYYLRAQKVRNLIRQDFKRVFQEVDVIASPVSPVLPFKIGERVTDPLQMYLADIYTVSANIASIPALSLPCGFSKAGLPIGWQFLGDFYSEALLINLGFQYQEITDWHRKKPTL